MRSLMILDSILILVGFILISLLFKLITIPTVGTFLINKLPENDYISIYMSVGIAILLSGLCIGKIIVFRIKQLPLYHALAIAIFACLYKAFRPDVNPISSNMQAVFLALTFFSILAGTYVARANPA